MAVTVKDLSVPLCFGRLYNLKGYGSMRSSGEEDVPLSVYGTSLCCKLWPGSILSRLDTEIGF